MISRDLDPDITLNEEDEPSDVQHVVLPPNPVNLSGEGVLLLLNFEK